MTTRKPDACAHCRTQSTPTVTLYSADSQTWWCGHCLLADRDRLREACEAAAERLSELVPGNSYGLLDHDADRERQATLDVVRAALAGSRRA